MTAPAPLAPELIFARGGTEETLQNAREHGPVLLVFYRLPASRVRLEALARAEKGLASAGLRLVAIAVDPSAAETAQGAAPDFTAAAAGDAFAAYALFAGSSRFDHCEFLVDRAGFLRARWCADLPSGLADASVLAADAERVAALPLEAAPRPAHAHAHDG